MTTFYVLVWIGYAFYALSQVKNSGEAVGCLVGGILWGAIWPIMIPVHIYQSISKKSK